MFSYFGARSLDLFIPNCNELHLLPTRLTQRSSFYPRGLPVEPYTFHAARGTRGIVNLENWIGWHHSVHIFCSLDSPKHRIAGVPVSTWKSTSSSLLNFIVALILGGKHCVNGIQAPRLFLFLSRCIQTLSKWLVLPQVLHIFSHVGHFSVWALSTSTILTPFRIPSWFPFLSLFQSV